MTYTSDDLGGLGAKLDALDLNDGERAALWSILDAATTADDEVSGYASPPTTTFAFAVGRFGSFRSSNQAISDGTSNTIAFFDEADALFGKRTG